MSAHLDIPSFIFKALDAVVFQAGVFCHGCMGVAISPAFGDLLRERRGSSCAAVLREGEEGEDVRKICSSTFIVAHNSEDDTQPEIEDEDSGTVSSHKQ
ncbi:hypothetical protein NQZ68_021750 [Dissostichus eleginoides]|nr:hypothetical protein NQZ68_021750 [Dissostichus eleginoides]